MRLFYITLNSLTEAETISHAILKEKIAVCCNWWPITCSYLYEGEIKQGSEVVLLVKTQAGKRPALEALLKRFVNYTHAILELDVVSANLAFANWLQDEVPA